MQKIYAKDISMRMHTYEIAKSKIIKTQMNIYAKEKKQGREAESGHVWPQVISNKMTTVTAYFIPLFIKQA